MPSPPLADTGPRLMWRLMRGLQRHYGYFTSPALLDLAGQGHRKTAENYLAFLKAEGVIETVNASQRLGEAHRYRILRDGDAPPARRADGSMMGERQQALWTAIRALRAFTPSELAMAATTERLPIGSDTARSYVRDLRIAGFLASVAPSTYRLLPARNSGPRAPIVMRTEGAAFDLNLMRVVNVNASQMSGRAA